MLVIETVNDFFQVKFDSASNSFSCYFTGYYENKSCSVMLGMKDSVTQECHLEKNQFENSSSDYTQHVIVAVPKLQRDLVIYFVATGTTLNPNLTIAVEGSFKTGAGIIL